MTTPVDIANRALAQIGTRSQLTGVTIDPTQSSEALYASLLYAPLRDFLLREGDYDWATQSAEAVATTGLVPPWTFVYTYPVGALRIRQLLPLAYAALDPRPIEWNVIDGGGIRKIFTNGEVQRIFYTIPPASEDLWDAIFTESYTRLLASALNFALENLIEASQQKLEQAITFAGIANLRDS